MNRVISDDEELRYRQRNGERAAEVARLRREARELRASLPVTHPQHQCPECGAGEREEGEG